jgi:ketosteroid isomerase-like protein
VGDNVEIAIRFGDGRLVRLEFYLDEASATNAL